MGAMDNGVVLAVGAAGIVAAAAAARGAFGGLRGGRNWGSEKYKIVRFYQRAGVRRRTIAEGLTLEQAQAHCNDPETSSRTATSSAARKRTRTHGPWFDGYERM